MPFVRQRYGKANVRVLRVQRAEERHEVREARVTVTLDGDFARAYTAADNSSVVPTDTMKNLVHVLALEHLDAANEPFALALAQCFLDRYEQVAEVQVEIDETVWSRMRIDGRAHEHSFVRSESGTPFARVTATRSAREICAGVRDLAIMKTTGSGFVDYVQDEYTTLPPTTDRIMATRLSATAWRFADAGHRPAARLRGRRRRHPHRPAEGVRHQLQLLGAGQPVPDGRVRPGRRPRHHRDHAGHAQRALPADRSVRRSGATRSGRLFLPTDEPNGQIEATLRRH